VGSRLETYFEKIFSLTLKVWRVKPKILPTRRHQLEARNFETAQRIDKHIRDVLSTINAL